MSKRAKRHLLIIISFVAIPAAIGGTIGSLGGHFERGAFIGAIVGVAALLTAEWSPGPISNHLDRKFGPRYPTTGSNN